MLYGSEFESIKFLKFFIARLIFDQDYFFHFFFPASIIGLSIPIGSLISGPLMDTFGRKKTNMIIGIPCIPAWFITCVASLDYPLLLYSMRFLVGFAAGTNFFFNQ